MTSEPDDYSGGGETSAGEALSEAQLAELRSKLGRWVEPYDIMRTTFAWDLLAEVIRARDAATERAEKAEAEAKRLRATIADEHSQLSHLLDNAEEVARLSGELVDAREANMLLRDGSKKLRTELDKCAELNRNLVNEAADMQVELDAARAHAQIAHDQTAELGGDVVELRARIDAAEQELAELRDDYANLQTEASQIADRAGQYQHELAELRERIGEPADPNDVFVPGHTYRSVNGYFEFHCERSIGEYALGIETVLKEWPVYPGMRLRKWASICPDDCWIDVTSEVTDHA